MFASIRKIKGTSTKLFYLPKLWQNPEHAHWQKICSLAYLLLVIKN